MSDDPRLTNKRRMADAIATSYQNDDLGYEDAIDELMHLGYTENEADNILVPPKAQLG